MQQAVRETLQNCCRLHVGALHFERVRGLPALVFLVRFGRLPRLTVAVSPAPTLLVARQRTSMSPTLVRAHFGGIALSLPLVFIFGSIALTDSLEVDIATLVVLMIEVVATLPWSAIAAFIFFLASDLSRQGNNLNFVNFLIPAILIPGAYFNGLQFGRYVSGLMAPKVETQSEGSASQ